MEDKEIFGSCLRAEKSVEHEGDVDKVIFGLIKGQESITVHTIK